MAMLAPARYIADFARFAASKGAQERRDAQALTELEATTLRLAPGLELQWLGVSGYRLDFGLAVPFELTCDHLDALRPSAYRCGQVWGIHIEVAGTTIYHQGSANLVDEAIGHRGVDFFLAGVAGRGFTRDYWRRILGRLQPSTIVPTHYDDFFRPLDADMGFTTNVNLARVPDEIHAVSADFAVAALPLLRTGR
jgi:hypothetical protein